MSLQRDLHVVLEQVYSYCVRNKSRASVTLWFQLDMFQLIVTPQDIDKVTIQLKDTPTKVYAIGAKVFYQRCPKKCFKMSIDPINSHASFIGKNIGSNKRNVPINKTVSSNWNQGVSILSLGTTFVPANM